MRRRKEMSFRYYHHGGLTTITNFTKLYHFILTHYNRTRIELMYTMKKMSFRYYHQECLTTITNFTKLNPFILTNYNK